MLIKAKQRKTMPFILDKIKGGQACFSLRRLRKGYFGPCINIRRSSDNAVQDIGFDSNGNLDVGAIYKFVGANSAFVATWYDQSGNKRHATQATTAAQPRIVNSGVLDTRNSRPAILFTQASGQFLGGFDVRSLNGTQYTVNAVESRTSTATTSFFMGNINNSANNTGLHFGYNDNTTIINGQVGNDLTATVAGYTATTTAIKTAILGAGLASTTVLRTVYDGGSSIGTLGSSTALTLTVAAAGLIGCGYNNVTPFCYDGYLQEVHFFNRNISGLRLVLEASQKTYFKV
jgi:hypothetical protein